MTVLGEKPLSRRDRLADVVNMSVERTLLRWAFRAVGLCLWVLPGTILKRVLPVNAWAARLYPDNPLAQAKVILAVMIAMLLVGTLCQATAWGLRRNKSWARGTGTAACIGLLFGFPWFSLLGAIGLFSLFSLPEVKETTTSDPTLLRPRESFAGWIVGFLSGGLWLAGMGWLSTTHATWACPRPAWAMSSG